MKTHTIDETASKKKPKFTVAEAARAFRQARGSAQKVERIEGEKEHVRRDDTGRFVLVSNGKSAAANGKSGKTRAPVGRPREKR